MRSGSYKNPDLSNSGKQTSPVGLPVEFGARERAGLRNAPFPRKRTRSSTCHASSPVCSMAKRNTQRRRLLLANCLIPNLSVRPISNPPD